MRKILLFFISLTIGTVLLVGVIRFVGWEEIQMVLYIFTGWQGIIIILLTGLTLFFGLWKWQIILKDQGYKISNKQLALPYLAGFSLVYLFPMLIFGGEFFRGYILKEKFDIPWRKGVVSVAIDRIIEGTAFLITVIAGTVFFLVKIGLPPRNIGIFMGGVIVILIIPLGYFYFKSFKKQSIAAFFAKRLEGSRFINGQALEIEKEIFNFFKIRKKAFWKALGLAFLRVAAAWARTWLLIIFLGKTVSILSALSVLGFYYLVLFVPIPAALGTHEVIQAFSFSALGIGVGTAPVFTMIQRGAEMVLAFAGLIILFRMGIDLIRAVLFRKLGNLLNGQ